MTRYTVRLLVECLLTLSVVLSGGPDDTDAYETIRQLHDQSIQTNVRRMRA